MKTYLQNLRVHDYEEVKQGAQLQETETDLYSGLRLPTSSGSLSSGQEWWWTSQVLMQELQ